MQLLTSSQVGTCPSCRPKWKRRPAADAEIGDVRDLRGYDSVVFTGELNQPIRTLRADR